MRLRPIALLLAAAFAGGCPSPEPAALPPMTDPLTALAGRLREHVTTLATEIGGRDIEHAEALFEAADYIERTWEAQGYVVLRQCFTVESTEVCNLEAELQGTHTPEEIVVVGAHYDTAWGNPGADDNGSGVAAMLELSAAFADVPQARTLRFVAFVNEEPPYFHTEAMGSLVYARRAARERDDIVAMFSLETMGYYDSAPGSQDYPKIVAPFFPDRGNFITFVGNGRSRRFVKQAVRTFEASSPFPVEFIAATDKIPGIGWSDHWSFYTQGYPAVMVTDTAPNRYPHYHDKTDTPEKLDYHSLARVVAGLQEVVAAAGRGEIGG